MDKKCILFQFPYRSIKMKMFVLKKFLFAMKLETGGSFRHKEPNVFDGIALKINWFILCSKGLIIGSVHLLIQAAIFLYCAAHLTIYDCSDFEKYFQLPENRICMFKRGNVEIRSKIMIVSMCRIKDSFHWEFFMSN